MVVRSSATNGVALFDAGALLGEKETQLAIAALILGFDLADFESLTIDDYVAAASETYAEASAPLTTSSFGDTGSSVRQLSAGNYYCIKMKEKLLHKIRCDWRDRHMAKWVNDNG